MRRIRSSLISVITLTILLGTGGPATGQFCSGSPIPVPNGCSVPFIPLFVANGLNYIFLGACNNHDRCYATTNPPAGNCLGFGTKFFCDGIFLVRMEAACALYASILAYPASGWVDADDFLEDCSYVSGLFFAAVAIGGSNAFRNRQCCDGCNRDMCDAIGQPLPSFCPFPGCGYEPPPPPGPPGTPWPPLPCGPIYPETATWIVGPSGDAAPAPEQLGLGLKRTEERPGAYIYMDEWALVSIGPGESGLERASEDDFGDRAAASTAASMPLHARESTVLVIEAAVHRSNGREIPTPVVVPFEVDLGRNRAIDMPDLWFRAEVDHSGKVDRVSFLDPGAELMAENIKEAIRSHLRLRYTGTRRHRAIVYGLTTLDERGRLTLRGPGFVTVPQCCCSGELCV